MAPSMNDWFHQSHFVEGACVHARSDWSHGELLKLSSPHLLLSPCAASATISGLVFALFCLDFLPELLDRFVVDLLQGLEAAQKLGISLRLEVAGKFLEKQF